MPRWDFRCPVCGYEVERTTPTVRCPACYHDHGVTSDMIRLPAAPSFVVTGYNARNGYSKGSK